MTQFNYIIAIIMDFRLSRITEHNKNEETDHLYDPLRDTLRKSSVSKGKSLARVTSAQQLHGSKVSRKIRELSPEQAERMQRQIWIPSDKKLKPTDHLTRVAGKQFYAVDVQERRGNTLTEEQFKRIYHGKQIHETVYEFGSSNNDSKQPSPFTLNQGSKTNMGQWSSSYQNKYKITEQNRNTNIGLNGNGTLHATNNAYGSEFGNLEGVDNRNTYVGFNDKGTFSSKGNQYGKVQSQRDSGSGVRFSRAGRLESGFNGDNKFNYQREDGSQKFNQYESMEPQLKGKTDSEKEGSSRRNSKYGRAKSSYKYNLFSSLDQAINTKCGSFGKNEIIAKKPQRPWG